MSSVADQCKAMGLSVGDTIEGREEYGGDWNEARLTVLWIGQDVAVFMQQTRDSDAPAWSEPEESADWTLDARTWRRVASQPASNL